MDRREPSRVRASGTHVTNPSAAVDPGLVRITAFREIVERGQYAKIDGIMVDLFSASAVVKVYDAVSPENQVKFRNLHAPRMVRIAFQLMK